MKTSIYNIWTPLVNEFIADIDNGLQEEIDAWLDKEGRVEFKNGQSIYFGSKIGIFKDAKDPLDTAMFDVSKDQINAGFKHWFKKLREQFPSLNNKDVKDKYKRFAEKCISEQFHPFIATRAVITRQFVQRGDFKDIGFVIDSYQFLAEAARMSVESMNEDIAKQQSAPPVPRNPTSPAFYKAAPPQELLTNSALANTLQ